MFTVPPSPPSLPSTAESSLRSTAVLSPDTAAVNTRIIRFFVGIHEEGLPGLTASEVEVNGEPGLLFHVGDEPLYLVTGVMDAEGRVRLALNVAGPTKFAFARRQRLRLPA